MSWIGWLLLGIFIGDIVTLFLVCLCSAAGGTEKPVRCKDCAKAKTKDDRTMFCMQFADTVHKDAFCSYGIERNGVEK